MTVNLTCGTHSLEGDDLISTFLQASQITMWPHNRLLCKTQKPNQAYSFCVCHPMAPPSSVSRQGAVSHAAVHSAQGWKKRHRLLMMKL